ncbi:MAG: hypothetical protein AB1478_02795 [Nitrospirota bacterium]
MVTTDLSEFGYRELAEAEKLLKAWREQGLPSDFEEEKIEIMFNANSGYVFLSNADYQVAMLNDGKLESFYTCPYCGFEGFKEEMMHSDSPECKEYLIEIGVIPGEEESKVE